MCDLGNSGFWDGDYGWGVRVRRPFGARCFPDDTDINPSIRIPASRRDGTCTKNEFRMVCVFITAGPMIKLCVCWLFIFKVTEPSSIPYRTHSACAKRAAYPDPPPVIPLPESGVAEVTHLPSQRSLGEPRPNRLSSEPGSASNPKCFQVMMILFLFLQKQNLGFAVYGIPVGIGTLLT